VVDTLIALTAFSGDISASSSVRSILYHIVAEELPLDFEEVLE